MNDKLQQLYNLYKQKGIINTTDFNTFASASDDQRQKLYDLGVQKGLFNTTDFNTFNTAWSGEKQEPLKKKESTDLVSKSGKPTSVSSSKEIEQPIKPKPVTKKVGGAEIIKGYPSDPNKEYKFENGVWYETKYTPTAQKPTRDISASGAVVQKGGTPNLNIQSEYVQIKSPSRVAELNRYFKKQGSTSTEFQTFTGLPGNENREYRVSDGNWIRKDKGTDNWVTITDEKNIAYLNSQFKQDVKPFKSKAEVDKAKDYNNLEKQFQNNLSYINSKLVDQSEESVVPKLQQLFPAFKFEQSQVGADRVMVTAPNGKQEEFLLDNYTFSQDKQQADMLRGWLNSNYDPKVAKEEAEIRGVEKMTEDKVNTIVLPGGGLVTTVTPSFVDREIAFPIIEEQAKKERADYYRAKSEQVKDIYNKYSDYVNKTGKVDDIEARAALAELKADDAEIKRLNAYQDDIKLDIQDYATKKKEAAVYLNNADAKLRNGEITQEQYDLQYKPQIEKMEADLKAQQSRIKVQTDNSDLVKKSAERAAAENFLIQESKGSFGGGLAYSAIKGLSSLPRLALGIMGIESKDLAENIARELGLYTTKEYMESEDRADLAKAAFALTESLVAASAGGSTAGNIALYGMGYYELKDELDQVEGMTEQQKMIMAGAYGMVSAALNRVGLDFALGKISSATGKSLKMGIMKNVFSSLPKDAPKEVIENAIMNETKKYLTSAGLDVVGGMVVEGSTEALESLSSAGIKELYDLGQKTDYFNKEGAGKVFEDALYEGYLGALGGGIMSTVYNAGQAGVRGMRANSDELKLLMKAAETEGMDSAVLASVKADMLSGKINKEQAKAIVDNFQEVKSKVDQMPSDINEEGKAIALNLMTERDELNKQIAGKDPNLVKPQTDRINEINNSLQQIPIDYAVQKQSTGEVPVQPTTGVSGKVEEGVSEAKPEGVTGETITEEVKVEEPKGEQPQAEVTQEEVEEVIKTKKNQDNEHEITINGEVIGKIFYDKSQKTWNNVDFDKTGIEPYSYKWVYGDVVGENKQEAIDEMVRRQKEKMPKPEEEAKPISMAEESNVKFTNDQITNDFLNSLSKKSNLSKNPINNQEFIYGDKASVDFGRFNKGDRKEISIESISTFEKGKGIGNEVMKDITDTADELGITLTLDAKPFGNEGLNKKQLINFYKKNGFVADIEEMFGGEFESEEELIDYVINEEPETALKMIRKPVALQPKVQEVVQETVQPEVQAEPTAKIETVEVQETPQAETEVKPKEKVEDISGFDRMMSELDGIIEKSRKRRVSEEKVLDNAMNYLQGSAVYERATDVQREQMVRDLRKKFGKREKSAPRVKKLFGEVKDVKKITMPEYDLMVKQIMDFEKGAKTTLAKVTKASKELTTYVEDMVKKGHITTNQAMSVLRKFSATNLLDENSVSNFVNYMRKVFNDAEYANKIANIRKKLPTAKKNIKTKIGIAKDLAPLMERVFAINPSIIPDEVFNKYSDAVMMMGERAAVLNLDEYNEIKENLIDVIDAVEMEAGLAEELVELFNDNKVVEEGKVNFSETLNKMFDEGLINEYERSLMKKYKSLFTEKQAKESKKAEKVEEAKKAVASATINSAELPTKDERDVAKKLAKLVNAKAYEMLTDDEVIQLSKVINNINNGFLTHKAEQLRERMSGLVKAKDLISPIQQVKVMFGELLKGNLKSKVTGENVYTNIIKGNSAAFIDEVFGNFKERPFFNNIYEPIAQAIQRFNDENKIIRDKVDKLENDLLRHFKNNGREATKSKFKMMTYMLQVENDSNPDSKQVNPAQAFIEKTIEKIENGTTSMYTDRDAKELQSIIDEYSVDGEIDSDKLYKSFSAEEKRILKGLRDINDSMTEKAEFTASVIRGNRINPINNYISLSTISDDTGNDQFSSIVDIRKMFDSTRQASTKAKSLIERTGKVSAINFDPFSSVRKSSSAVLMDYNMTPTIRESRIALKQLENDVKEGVLDKSKRDFVNALRDSFDLIVDNAIGNNMLQGTLEDSVIAELAKQGYRTMLASIDRAAGELLSNTMFVTFVAPVTWAKGTAYSKFLMSSDFFNLLNNVGSTQTSRIKPGNTLSNRMIDTSILQQATGLKGSSVKSEVRNRAEQIYNLTGKKVKNVAELTADTLISTPDKIMMQPLWMGTFASEFKKETGVDVDVNKLAANDEAYMDKYADAIEKARREADDITVRAGSTDNGALAVLRNTISPEQKASRFWKWYKTFNGFMSKFLLFEYMTARSAIYQLFKEGRISKKEAVAELAAVTARMTMYSVVISMLGESVIDMAAGLLGYRDDEDDEEEKKKTLAQEVGQGLASTFTTMMFGRNFGNVARAPINMGVEYLNQKYLDFLRNGEYDPYTDQLQYTIAPKEESKDPFMDIALNTVGPISPFIKTGRFIGKYMYAPEGKTEDKKERQRKEKWRVALEVPGSLGFVPFYNNIRKVQQDWIYGDLKKAEKITYENIGSKIQSAKSTMSSEISKAVKESASGTITSEEMNARISEAQMLYLEKIQDYMKRLR